ncbi:MAG: AbrB/MazE/SpoVT family DNA-binding domain-containing protein [Candidatus Poribacteria bacterium]|nr:AbrB/MazE/SpoVT family DNA-binding domain-containing protein [Candidatus Poribacteria bacterium]
MSLVKVRPKGQITLPKKVRDELDLREGDLVEAEVIDGQVVITPKKLVKEDALRRLNSLFERMRERNPHITEEQAIEDALNAIDEHRREQPVVSRDA